MEVTSDITRVEQENLTEQYHYLIGKTIRAMNIPHYVHDDYYGCAAEGLWKAVLKYGDDTDFTNYAISIIRDYIKDERKRNMTRGRGACTIISIHNKNIQSKVENRSAKSFENNLILRCDFEENNRLYNNRDKEIIAMKYQGYSNIEIALELNISESLVRKRLKYIKRNFEKVL